MISVVHDRLDRHHRHLVRPGVRVDRLTETVGGRTERHQTASVRMPNGAYIAQQLTVLRFALQTQPRIGHHRGAVLGARSIHVQHILGVLYGLWFFTGGVNVFFFQLV